jgi:2'-5' RNA ligase
VTRTPGGGHTVGIAITIPAPFGAELDAARERYAPGADGMAAHVTILAPIDVDADVMGAVDAHLASVAQTTRPFRLLLRGAGTFRPVSPVVFVAVADGIAACEQLERRVRSGDLAVETRFPYHPHVTMAHDVSDSLLDQALDDLADYRADMVVDSLGLHENVGGRWVLVREYPFGG